MKTSIRERIASAIWASQALPQHLDPVHPNCYDMADAVIDALCLNEVTSFWLESSRSTEVVIEGRYEVPD